MPTGIIAPPTIDIISQDEPGLVSSPIPLIPNAKIVGNMMDIKKPKPPSAYTIIGPVPKTAIKHNTIEIKA